MTLYLFDTASRRVREFVPLREGHASIYLCGATVQSIPHIGHLRASVAFDILRNWLEAQGLDVAFVRNVTDIDDKILAKAQENGRPWWEWAATHERAFTWAYDKLGVKPPSVEPRATGHITEMISYMQRIIDAGHGYEAEGSVYCQPTTISNYGFLSGQKIDEVDQGEQKAVGKRDPRDFAMWKAAKPGEPYWDTPWGKGRPGWHIECSAMATKYLGPEFDIHCGGLDLQFPHHENEAAQAHAAGDPFARYWLHNGWVTMGGEKMSKSLGNVLSVPNILTKVRPVELRYYLGSGHYRSMLEYSEASLQEAAAGYRRVESFLKRVQQSSGSVEVGEVRPDFREAMDNDLAVPLALAVIHKTVREGNSLMDSSETYAKEKAHELAQSVRAMMAVLGVDPLSELWAQEGTEDSTAAMRALDVMVRSALERRAQAREQKDWNTADEVRDSLEAAGIRVTDTAEGAQWELAPEK